jgi:hypothetical protein
MDFIESKIEQLTRKNYLHVMRDLKIEDKHFTPIKRYMSVISKSKIIKDKFIVINFRLHAQKQLQSIKVKD